MASSAYAEPEAGDVIPDSYIVVLKDDISEPEFEAHQRLISTTYTTSTSSDNSRSPFDFTYNIASFKGYAGTFSRQSIDQIAGRPDVAYIEPNKVVTAEGDEIPIGSEAEAVVARGDIVTQSNPPSWGLIPISHHNGSLNPTVYAYDATAGEGIDIYVLDTGIRISHKDLGGRARWGANFIPDSDDTDHRGHGTHVTGTIIGTTFGVAKRAKAVAVKVLGDTGHGSIAGIIAGIDWAVGDARGRRAVINMSLGSSRSKAMNTAVDNAVGHGGVTVVVAAGNQATDASTRSPASAASAITVGSVDRTITRAQSSNYGPCVNIFAPGVRITSCGIKNDTDAVEKSGTSMASPHVAGVAAYLIILYGLKDPAAVRDQLLTLATRNIVKDPGPGSPNLFLYNGSGM